jgi:hypothetical protein
VALICTFHILQLFHCCRGARQSLKQAGGKVFGPGGCRGIAGHEADDACFGHQSSGAQAEKPGHDRLGTDILNLHQPDATNQELLRKASDLPLL